LIFVLRVVWWCMPFPRGIISDVDGVLFDSEQAHRAAWMRVFGRRGITVSAREYEKGVGMCDMEFLEGLGRNRVLPPESRLPEILAEKRAALLDTTGSVPPYPGAGKTLEVLSGTHALCAASNSDADFVRAILAAAGFAKFFRHVLSRQDIVRPKPFPDIYLLAAEKLGAPPSECLVIEDSPIGVRAAKNAGARCCAVTHTVEAARLSEADWICDTLSPESVQECLDRMPVL